MTKISSLEELKRAATYNDKDSAEFFIVLNFGAKSSKKITYYPDTDTFDVFNWIDDTWQDDIPAEELGQHTLIIEAIEKEALYQY